MSCKCRQACHSMARSWGEGLLCLKYLCNEFIPIIIPCRNSYVNTDMVCLIVTIQTYPPPINGTLPLSISLNALSLFILFSFNNLRYPPISTIVYSCVYRTSNAILVIHLIVNVDKIPPPPFGRSPLSNHFWKRFPPVNSLCFIYNTYTHFGIMTDTYHISRPRGLIDCSNGRYNTVRCCWKPNKPIGGGKLLVFKHIHNTSFGIVIESDIISDGSILVSRIQSTGDTTRTYILSLYVTEIQRSLQSRFLHLSAVLVGLHSLLPDSSHRTLQAFRH